MWVQTVFVCEAFMELLEEARQSRPALHVRCSVMSSVTRNISALQIFQVSGQEGRDIWWQTECLCSWPYKNCPKEIISLHVYSCTLCFETWNIWILSKKFLEERNESIVDFFQTLDKEGTMKVSTSAFRKAVKVRLTLKTSYIHTRHYKNRKLPDWAEVFRYSLLYG